MNSLKFCLAPLFALNGQNDFQNGFNNPEVVDDMSKLEDSMSSYKEDETMIAFALSRLAYYGLDSYMNDTEGFIGCLISTFSTLVIYRGGHKAYGAGSHI
jgi:hypothetical protein